MIVAIAAVIFVLAGSRARLPDMLAHAGAGSCAEQPAPGRDGAPPPSCADLCRHCLRADAPFDGDIALFAPASLEPLDAVRRATPAAAVEQRPRPYRAASWSSRAPPARG